MTFDTAVTTSRLVLRAFRRDDLGAMHEVLGDAQVMRFSLSGPYSMEQTTKFIQARLDDVERRTAGLFAVSHISTEKVIGYCGFYHPVIDGVQEVEISYRLSRSYWGQGLATEAAAAVKDFGVTRCGYSRFISCIEEENRASIRVAEKIGMRHEKDALFSRIPVRIYSIDQSSSAATRL